MEKTKMTSERLQKTLEHYREVSYKDLTDRDFDFLRENGVCNGCGGAGDDVKNVLIRWILQWSLKQLRVVFIEASCDIHDFSYWKGGMEEDRQKADMGFFKKIINDIDKTDSNVIKYSILAMIFYYSVHFGGKSYFNYHT